MARTGKTQEKSGVGGSASGTTGRGSFVPVQWVNPYLDNNDKRWLEDNYKQCNELVLEFVDALSETASLSSKYDSRSDRWLASVVFTGDGDPNNGWAVSMRGATRIDSLYALSYVVGVKLGWKVANSSEGTDLGKWG